MKKVRNIISFIIILVAIITLIVVYKKYNYNNFEKKIRIENITKFTRDSDTKFSKVDSYKIENTDYNAAMFSQAISVIPNTAYRITCMVKTENIINKNDTSYGGAHICLVETNERSKSISGTTNWQKITFLFNSKNNTQVNIGFRLGGTEELSKGTAWFSDFKVEASYKTNNNTEWKMACFIFPNIDVNVEVDGKIEHVKLKMSNEDVNDIKENFSKMKESIQQMSNNKMSIKPQTIIINEPIKSLSYDEENGYYVSGADVAKYINPYLEKEEYDHIFIALRMADKQIGSNTLVSDWIGLGGMDYQGIGFSNIRMPDDENNLVYKYDYRINTFPEEVFIHEFLHTLERNAKEYNYERPELHDYSKYGYKEEKLEGLRKWYIDYMNKNISYNGTKIGLPSEIYSYKPVHESDFKYAMQMDDLQEPDDILEVISSVVSRIKKVFSYAESVNE